MMSNNKILTVSYGTFSCTLEGFDDAFGTMKAIAEYFRDLASEDRYFGAEPPQPDAEMLARIAEHEIARRVEAREQNGRIVLSAEAAQATGLAAVDAAEAVKSTPEPAEEHPAEFSADEQQAVAEDARDSTADVTEAEHVSPDAMAPGHAETLAEKLRRIRAVVEQQRATDVEESGLEEDEIPDAFETEEGAGIDSVLDSEITFDEITSDEEREEDFSPASGALIFDEDWDGTAEIELPAALSSMQEAQSEPDEQQETAADTDRLEGYEFADVDADDAVAESELETEETALADPAEPVTEIPADIGTIEEETFEEETFEEVVAEAAIDQDISEFEDLAEEDASEVAEDRAEHAMPPLLLTEAEAVSISEPDDQASQQEEAHAADAMETIAEEIAEEIEENTETAAEIPDADTDSDDLDAILARLETADAGEETADNLFEEDQDTASDDADTDATEEEIAAFFASDDDDDTDTSEPEPRGRVVKVSRAELEDAIARGEIEEIDEPDETEVEDFAETSLSPDEEAELRDELAAVEAEFETEEDEPKTAEPRDPHVAENDVSRLMAEAESQMEQPEASSRRSAFAHLRAAVAARLGDKEFDQTEKNARDEEEGAYRSDLASVVRPRRPERGSATDRRPSADRPAPLKLVAEQRVDVSEHATASSGPIRPRRVGQSARPAPAAATAESFEDYAVQVGAHDLPDLLEAAASYLAFVEGFDQFSRPQLMTKVRQVEKDEFSREDSLRCFGQLLRAGKIEKVKGGRFVVTHDISYHPDKRAAG